MAGILSEIRDNNYLQPNRQFTIRGDVKSIERETNFTKIVISVFNYYANNGLSDEFTIWFKGNPKKIADKAIQVKHNLLVMGDIVLTDGIIYFSGKIIEVFKSAEYVTFANVKYVDPKEVAGGKAY